MKIENAVPDLDRRYQALLDAHRGLSEQESAALNSRLILILSHEITDQEAFLRCVKAACETTVEPG